VIIATDIHINMDRFGDKPVYAVSTSEAIRRSRAVIEEALAEAEDAKAAAAEPAPAAVAPVPAPPDASKFLVGVTSCPTGIAHTLWRPKA
jgi:PTS system fructose-specific IIC component